jgi:RHS repeat-associated protein
VTKGSAPTFSVAYSASTNRRTSDSAAANGNIQNANGQWLNYDIDNRISNVLTSQYGSTVMQYGYDAENKRVWRGSSTLDELTFWAPNGQKLATYQATWDPTYYNYYPSLTQTWVYFGGKMVSKGVLNLSNSSQDKVDLSSVVQDRLGSQNGKFYPYGIERPSASANDTEKFATYTRDSATGLDYAVNRYEQPGYGRFLSPDPYKASAGAGDPGSWNRYAYTRGDPVNRTDQSGRADDDGCPYSVCVYGSLVAPDMLAGSGGIPVPNQSCAMGDYKAGNCELGTADDATLGGVRGNGKDDFAGAASRLLKVAGSIVDLWSSSDMSEACHNDLEHIGVTQQQVIVGLQSVNILNAWGNQTSFASTYSTNQQANSNVKFRGSVWAYFMSNPGTNATAQLGGHDVYIDATWVNSSSFFNENALMGLLLHEVLHNVAAQVDSVLQAALGIPVQSESDNVTQKLIADCFWLP